MFLQPAGHSASNLHLGASYQSEKEKTVRPSLRHEKEKGLVMEQGTTAKFPLEGEDNNTNVQTTSKGKFRQENYHQQIHESISQEESEHNPEIAVARDINLSPEQQQGQQEQGIPQSQNGNDAELASNSQSKGVPTSASRFFLKGMEERQKQRDAMKAARLARQQEREEKAKVEMTINISSITLALLFFSTN